MAARPKFENPPIKEAILNFSFTEAIDIEKLKTFSESVFIKGSYPNTRQGVQVQISNTPEAGAETLMDFKTSHKFDGFMAQHKDDENKLIQVRSTQFSFHNTNKYMGWESMISEFKNIWEKISESIGRIELSQISARYVNQIKLPLPLKNGFEEYITILPQIPPGISSSINNFFTQLSVPNEDGSLTGVITETFLPVQNNATTLDFILDINASKQGPFAEGDKWKILEEIHDFKNDLFISCITNETQKLF